MNGWKFNRFCVQYFFLIFIYIFILVLKQILFGLTFYRLNIPRGLGHSEALSEMQKILFFLSDGFIGPRNHIFLGVGPWGGRRIVLFFVFLLNHFLPLHVYWRLLLNIWSLRLMEHFEYLDRLYNMLDLILRNAFLKATISTPVRLSIELLNLRSTLLNVLSDFQRVHDFMLIDLFQIVLLLEFRYVP